MLVIGLTGSIGMGKSTTAALFRNAGVPVHDADATVHALYSGRAAPLIGARFPGTVENGAVNREKLAAAVLGNPAEIAALEALVHPLVREEEIAFLSRARAAGRRHVVLDIPLLFESGGADRVDCILVVSAPPAVQKARVMARPGMTDEKFDRILARQMPDSEKRRRAHAVIDTGNGIEAAEGAVAAFLRALAAHPGTGKEMD